MYITIDVTKLSSYFNVHCKLYLHITSPAHEIGGVQKKERLTGGRPTALIKLAISRILATLVPLLASAEALLSSAFLCAFAISFCIFSCAFALFSSSFLCKFCTLFILVLLVKKLHFEFFHHFSKLRRLIMGYVILESMHLYQMKCSIVHSYFWG